MNQKVDPAVSRIHEKRCHCLVLKHANDAVAEPREDVLGRFPRGRPNAHHTLVVFFFFACFCFVGVYY